MQAYQHNGEAGLPSTAMSAMPESFWALFIHLSATRAKALPIAFLTFIRSIAFPRTPLKRSPVSRNRGTAFEILKLVIFRPFFTSSQCNGIETGAPGLGRSE